MKTALTIDGNYLLNKDVFILLNMKTLHQDLLNLLNIDMGKLMKLYPFDRIYFVSDSKVGYWRKQIYSDYKTSRKHDDKVDWGWVFEEYNTFIDMMGNNPQIEQVRIDYAEGDDIIAYIMNKNNEEGYSNVLVASDSDLHQLLRFDLDKNYINIAYNYKFSDEKVFLPENYRVFLSENKSTSRNNLFDMNNDDDFIEFLEDLIDRTRSSEVKTEELLFVKLVSGDKKDTITSVFEKVSDKGKISGIGKTGALSMYNLYKETYGSDSINFDSDEFINKCVEIVSFSKKIEDEELKLSIRAKLKRNRKLTKLTSNYLPGFLLEDFENIIRI